MIPLQWLIDFLLDFQKQGPVTQIGFLVAIVTAVLGTIAWLRRAFRRGYARIEGENAELRRAVTDHTNALSRARREQKDLQHAFEALHASLPDSALERVEEDIRENRREIALNRVQGLVTEIAPGFGEGCLRLAEFVLSLSVETGTNQYLADAERYTRIAALLDPERKDAPAILAEIETKRAAASVDLGDYATATGHAEAAMQYVGGDLESAGPLLDRIIERAQQDYRHGFYYSASVLWRRAAVLASQMFGSDHPKTLTIENNVAASLNQQGRYDEAKPLLERALAILEKALGPEHPDVATSLNNLAELHRAQGRYNETLPLYVRALAIREEALGHEHSDVAVSLNNLAGLHCDQGRYDEARPLYERALAIREKALGPEHPDAAIGLNNLATLHRAQGRCDEARPLYERALAILEKALGPEHPDVATSLNNLAELHRAQGRYDQARPLYERALAIREEALGHEHARTRETRAAFDALGESD